MSTSSVPDPRVVDVQPVSVRMTKPTGDERAGDGPPRATVFTGEVGAFRQGDARSRWALARYLVARTIGDGAVRALLVVAVLFAALTVLLAVVAPTALAVLAGVVTVGWLIAWRLARALWTRLSGGAALEPVQAELTALVGETRPDVRRELRRLDLPAHPFAAFVFARRLVGRRRAETTARMKQFDVDRVVPADRVDRLYLLLERTGPAAAPRRG